MQELGVERYVHCCERRWCKVKACKMGTSHHFCIFGRFGWSGSSVRVATICVIVVADVVGNGGVAIETLIEAQYLLKEICEGRG